MATEYLANEALNSDPLYVGQILGRMVGGREGELEREGGPRVQNAI